jgi:hypothetical protein
MTANGTATIRVETARATRDTAERKCAQYHRALLMVAIFTSLPHPYPSTAAGSSLPVAVHPCDTRGALSALRILRVAAGNVALPVAATPSNAAHACDAERAFAYCRGRTACPPAPANLSTGRCLR